MTTGSAENRLVHTRHPLSPPSLFLPSIIPQQQLCLQPTQAACPGPGPGPGLLQIPPRPAMFPSFSRSPPLDSLPSLDQLLPGP
jgi:hypothetical protein